MLVLSRRRDESIIIGDEIEITIVDIRGDTVRVGINAPRAVSVHRKEVYETIKAENIENMKKQTPAAATVGDLAQLIGNGVFGKNAGAAPTAKPAPASRLSQLSAPAPKKK